MTTAARVAAAARQLADAKARPAPVTIGETWNVLVQTDALMRVLGDLIISATEHVRSGDRPADKPIDLGGPRTDHHSIHRIEQLRYAVAMFGDNCQRARRSIAQAADLLAEMNHASRTKEDVMNESLTLFVSRYLAADHAEKQDMIAELDDLDSDELHHWRGAVGDLSNTLEYAMEKRHG